jgi:hypothetical protein
MASDSVVPVSVACRCGRLIWRAEPVRRQWAPMDDEPEKLADLLTPGDKWTVEAPAGAGRSKRDPESLGSIIAGSALVREALARHRASSSLPFQEFGE